MTYGDRPGGGPGGPPVELVVPITASELDGSPCGCQTLCGERAGPAAPEATEPLSIAAGAAPVEELDRV